MGDNWQWGNYYDTREEAEGYRKNWVETCHGLYADDSTNWVRVKLEGRIGGFQ